MGRRRYTVRAKCTHEGCNEWTFWEAETRVDEARLRRGYARDWKCTRHRDPESVLSPTNTRRVTEIVNERNADLDRLFWSSGSGFVYGEGWKAYATDFPEGTRIRVTAEVLFPGGEGGEQS